MSEKPDDTAVDKTDEAGADDGATPKSPKGQPVEVGGRKGPEPTRYGDWEKNGLISDF